MRQHRCNHNKEADTWNLKNIKRNWKITRYLLHEWNFNRSSIKIRALIQGTEWSQQTFIEGILCWLKPKEPLDSVKYQIENHSLWFQGHKFCFSRYRWNIFCWAVCRWNEMRDQGQFSQSSHSNKEHNIPQNGVHG